MLSRTIARILLLSAALIPVGLLSCRKNHAPYVPGRPSGPEVGDPDTPYSFKVQASDPDNDAVRVRIVWADGDTSDWSNPIFSEAGLSMTHAWHDTGMYAIAAQAKDGSEEVSGWSPPHSIYINPDLNPGIPSVPSGSSFGRKNSFYPFTTSVIDPDTDLVRYRFDWGDGDTSPWGLWHQSGAQDTASHAWTSGGMFAVRAQADDTSERKSPWSGPCSIHIASPPAAPSRPSGPVRGMVDVEIIFSASAADPDTDSVSLRFDWGDGSTSDWSRYVSSGDTIQASHSWHDVGGYSVRAQARDLLGDVSDWSYSHGVGIIAPDSMMLWCYETGGEVNSSPALGSDGTIYVCSNDGCVYAFNPDGTLKWRFSAECDADFGPSVADDGTVYAAARAGNLVALNPDGTVKWRFQTGHGINGPALGADGAIYVASRHDSIYAINADGTGRWTCIDTGAMFNDASPAVGPDGTIYLGSAWHVVALSNEGLLKWRFEPHFTIRSEFSIDHQGILYASSSGGDLRAIRPDGSAVWVIPWLCSYSEPVIDVQGTLYVGSTGVSMCALSPDGTERWRFSDGAGIRVTPALSADGTLYFGADDSCFYALSTDGNLKWRFRTGGGIRSSAAIGADGTVYFGSEDYCIYAMRGTSPLANSPWPKFQHDERNTGCAVVGR